MNEDKFNEALKLKNAIKETEAKINNIDALLSGEGQSLTIEGNAKSKNSFRGITKLSGFVTLNKELIILVLEKERKTLTLLLSEHKKVFDNL